VHNLYEICRQAGPRSQRSYTNGSARGDIIKTKLLRRLRSIKRDDRITRDSYSERRAALRPRAIRRCSRRGRRRRPRPISAPAPSEASGRPWWTTCAHHSDVIISTNSSSSSSSLLRGNWDVIGHNPASVRRQIQQETNSIYPATDINRFREQLMSTYILHLGASFRPNAAPSTHKQAVFYLYPL